MQYSLYICDTVFRIDSEYEFGRNRRYWSGYLLKEPAREPDYCISVSMVEIAAQRESTGDCDEGTLERYVVFRKITELLLEKQQTILMHGSVVAVNGLSYMFTAPSGTGKTTHSRLWLDNLKDAYILNGDKPYISVGESVAAWGTPWCGMEGYNKNLSVPLRAICILERAPVNVMRQISFQEAFPVLLAQSGIPSCPRAVEQTIRLLALMKDKVCFYRFKMNNFKDDAFNVAYHTLMSADRNKERI